MQLTDEQVLSGQEAFEDFQLAMGERFAPYATQAVLEGNLEAMVAWGRDNFPSGLTAMQRMGGWEIAFRECVGSLRRDPDWKSRADRNAELQREFDSMPAAESRARYESDPEYRRFVDGR